MELNEYINNIPEQRIERFNSILNLVKSMYPTAILSMKYKMPTFTQDNGWVAIANQKNYISVYTCSAEHLSSFKVKNPKIKTGKGCINLQDRDEIPFNDLKVVIKSALESSH